MQAEWLMHTVVATVLVRYCRLTMLADVTHQTAVFACLPVPAAPHSPGWRIRPSRIDPFITCPAGRDDERQEGTRIRRAHAAQAWSRPRPR